MENNDKDFYIGIEEDRPFVTREQVWLGDGEGDGGGGGGGVGAMVF